MKRILVDYLRRWWMAYGAILVGHFFLERYAIRMTDGATFRDDFIESTTRTEHSVLNVFRFQVLMFLSLLLPGDLFRGRARVLRLLPVTPQESGRALWIANVLIPGVALMLVNFLCVATYSTSPLADVPWIPYLFKWGLSFVTLGAVFGILSLGPAAGKRAGNAWASLSTIGFMLPLGGLYFAQKHGTPAYVTVIMFLVLTALTVAGWIRCGRVMTQAAGMRWIGAVKKKSDWPIGSFRRYGGLPYLISRTIIRSSILVISMIALSMIFFKAMALGSTGDFGLARLILTLAEGGVLYIFLAFDLFQLLAFIRGMRTLPLSSKALAAIVLFLPIACIYTDASICALLATILGGEALVIPLFKAFSFLAAAQAIGTLVVLVRGSDQLAYFTLLAAVIGNSFLKVSLGPTFSRIPDWVNPIATVLVIAIAFAIAHRLITRSSRVFKTRPGGMLNWSQAQQS